MVSAAPLEHVTANYLLAMYDHDPGVDTATVLGGGTPIVVDMKDYTNFAVVAMTTISGAGQGIQLLEIIASTATTMAAPVVIRAHAATVADATGDYVVLEITDSDLQAVATADLRYVAARITMDDAADEAAVLYFGIPKRSYTGLTATTIA